ncbi:MAG TPA: hypothetical protein VHW09_12120 [Bryobacteraceae bacterium]|jgi:hypothetical protein|nr:hypothetical protein [Bryobacteraceae bacterium]
MFVRLFAFAILPALLLGAPAKKQTVGSGRGENEDMILSATLYTTPADVKELIGDDLGGHYMVAEIKIEPKYGKTINIDRDDFVLHTDNDGSKTTPFAPSQIAGSEALIVSQDGAKEKKGGLMIGGIGGGIGSTGSDPGNTKVKVQNPGTQKETPLEKLLREKILVEQKTAKPASGLLYFPMEKQKLKNLEIRYGPQASRITLRFK